MLNSDCNCCTVNGASIYINSVSVTKTCQPEQGGGDGGDGGGGCFTDPEDTSECPTLYSTIVTTVTQSGSYNDSTSCGEGEFVRSNYSGSMNATIITTTTCDGETTEQSGSSSSSGSTALCEGGEVILSGYCSSTLTNEGWSGSYSGTEYGIPQGPFEQNGPCVQPTETNTTITYSDPISNEEELFTPDPECEAEQIPFPEFPDKCQFGCQTDDDCDEPPTLESGQGYEQTAYDFSINGEIVEQKFKYKIVHSAPSTCYLKVWTREKIYKYVKKTPDPDDLLDPTNPCDKKNPQNYQYWEADDEEPFSYGSEQTYTWSGSTVKDGLCVDPEKGLGHCDNYEETSIRTVNATSGREVFLEMKYSFVEGYEPDWPDTPNSCKPNGFPNPDCE